MDERKIRQLRSVPAEFQTREDGDDLIIEGYFAVFNSNYEIAPGMSESIASGAFSNSISGDVRALINHDTTLVLGRTAAHTLELREDTHGLWGRIVINPNDSDAMNARAKSAPWGCVAVLDRLQHPQRGYRNPRRRKRALDDQRCGPVGGIDLYISSLRRDKYFRKECRAR